MNLTDDMVLKFQSGEPIFLDDICAVYFATLREIVQVGYSKFQTMLGAITATKPSALPNADSEMQQILAKISDFQYILLLVSMDKEANQVLKDAFSFFTHETVTFSTEPAQIVVGPIEEKHILNEEKFYELQRILRRGYFVNVDEEEIIINPDDPPATVKLKLQMRANREKVRKAKAKKALQEKNDLHFSDLIGSVTINNCNLNMENVWNLTYYAFHDQLRRMGWRDQFNINNKAALAGAKLKKNQLKHWMRSIESSDKT